MNMNTKYKHLLFDADNTLFDFNAAERRAFLALFEIDSLVFNEKNYSLYHDINDAVWKRLEKHDITKTELKSLRFRELYRELNLDVTEEKIALIVETYPKILALGTDLINGAFEVVSYLSKNYDIYIITNGLYDVQTARLAKSKLRPYIKELFVSEKVGCEKPGTKFFDFVLSTIGDGNRDNYIVIGDSLTSDIDGAIASGIDCIYYDPEDHGQHGRKVTHRINELGDLLKLI